MSELVENASVQRPTQKKRRRILIFCVVSLVNIGLLALIGMQLLTPASHSESDPLIGHPAPDFSLALLHPPPGESDLALADFKGRAVVLNFWASWCDPCKEEAPLLEGSWQKMQAQQKNVVFLGIDFEETSSAAIGFLQSYSITYPAVLDANGSAATSYGITSLPDTIFINRNGVVTSKVSQQLTAQLLASGLQTIL